MKAGKIYNKEWDDEYDEFLETETRRKEELKLVKAFKKFAEPRNPEKRKLSNSR